VLALAVYGVVVDDAGEVDEDATLARRRDARQARRDWAADPADPSIRIRVTNASDRLAELGGWCERRNGIDIVERVDPDTGSLLGVTLEVAEGA
jgi:N-methylhydantoinase B